MIARWVVVLALLGVPESAGAQSFIFSRYATATSFSLYGGYGPGRGFGFVGLVQNPRTGYRESLVGAGWRFGTGGAPAGPRGGGPPAPREGAPPLRPPPPPRRPPP